MATNTFHSLEELTSVLAVSILSTPCRSKSLNDSGSIPQELDYANHTAEQMALTEVGYLVVRMLQTFGKIEKRDDDIYRERMGVTLSFADGVKAALYE